MIKKLKQMPYAQAHVTIYDDNTTTLRSYTTVVATLTKDKWLTIHGLYSMTTRKHIGAFMKEYCNSNYAIAKDCYVHNYMLNIETGEIRFLNKRQ